MATVDATGLVTAVAAGTATITASAGDVRTSVEITVVSATQPVVSVEVSPSAETITLGGTLQLSAAAFDENGQAVSGAEFSWESNNTPVATVDASGLVTGVAEGSATIFASAGSVQGRAHIAVVNPVASPDREILVALYNATDGQNWGHAFNWLTDAPLGDWSGVETNALGRVTELNLPFNDLSGSLPVELGNLASLTTLRLEFNELSGPIPGVFGNLSSLENVDLSFNELSGPIPPELGKLTNLTELDLSWNELSGPVPPELTDLTRLEILNLGGNFLTGSIPPEIGNLTNLEILNLGNRLRGFTASHGLTGPIPPGTRQPHEPDGTGPQRQRAFRPDPA